MTTTTSTTTPAQAAAAANAPPISTSSTGQAVGTDATQQLASNFNSFLTLLTTQLQNQDPLDPLDTNQFTQQLVEFTSVQQQVDMNTNLQTLITLQQTAAATSAMQFIGSTVTLTGTTSTLAAGSPATWSLTSPSPATGTVTITNSSGQTAYTGSVSLNAGTQTYSWNGQGSNGVTWPAGQYNLAITDTSASGKPVTVSTQIQGTVSGVNLSQNPPQLIVNGQSYPVSAIQSISSSSTNSISSLSNSISSLNSRISSLSQLL